MRGLWLFLVTTAASGQDLPPLPKVAPLPPKLFYFAATATENNGMESDFSNEVWHTNTNQSVTVTLAWDASLGTNTITNYTVYMGRASGTYSNRTYAGTNLSATVRLYPPPKTNRVITLYTVNATNLQYSTRPQSPWLLAGKTNLCFTNPAIGLYYRPLGASSNKPAKAFISVRVQ